MDEFYDDNIVFSEDNPMDIPNISVEGIFDLTGDEDSLYEEEILK